MFRDEHRDKVWNEIRQHDLRSFRDQLTPQVFAAAAAQAGVKFGRSALNVMNLAWLGIACAMQHTATFSFVLTTTLKLLEDQEKFYSTSLGKERRKAQKQATTRKNSKGKRSKHDPRSADPTQVTEEAFAQARQKMPVGFWCALLTLLAEAFQQQHAQQLKFRGFRLLAMDGTTLTLPNDERLRQHYGTAKNGQRKRACPQARMVLLTLPGVRIPLAYEESPLATSELNLAKRLMCHLRQNDLVLMDRGFVSYGLFCQIQACGAFFGTRLKKGLKLKKVKQLGPKDRLVEWTPKDSRGKWKKLPRSMKLRVIDYQVPGFRSSAIVTNVLDPKKLSREDWVRMAVDCEDKGKLKPGLYHRRWEIESTYFELKITLKLKSLRSRTPKSFQYELAGHLVYYLLVRWLIVQAAEKHGLDPLRISFSDALRELEQMRGVLITSSHAWIRNGLLPRLLARIASHLVPLRPGRHYPRPNDTKIKDMGNGEKRLASKLTKRINTNYRNKIRNLVHQA